jgi:methyl-accepting chemotaxis protein
VSLTGVAALIAAVSFAVLAGAGVYLAVRFTRVLGDAATLVRETSAGSSALLARANAAVDRANTQLDKHETVAAAMDDLGASVTELAGQASALAGIGRTVGGAVIGGPLGKAAAVAYGVRHAVVVRRTRARALPGQVVK